MQLTVTKRAKQTKAERSKRLRQGFVPGAVYGKGLEPFLVEVSARGIADVLIAETGMNTMIDLSVDGDTATHSVLIDNLERNPVTRGFISVGFHQVRRGDKVTAQVPVQLIGIPSDVTLNDALLDHLLESITVHAEPGDLPAHLDVDVSQMKIGDVLSVADLPHNPKLEFMAGEEVAIAAVHRSKTAQDVEQADEAAAEAAADLTGADAVTEMRSDADRDSDSVVGTTGA